MLAGPQEVNAPWPTCQIGFVEQGIWDRCENCSTAVLFSTWKGS